MPSETLVLLPGFLCDRTVWEGQIAALADLARPVVPDYGDLDSLGAMAEYVLDTVPGAFSVAGHSMGGRVALEVYRRAPLRVRRIGLFNTGCQSRPEGAAGDAEAQARYSLLETARSEGMGSMTARWIPPMVHPDRLQDTALLRRIVEMFGRKTPEIQEAQIRALLNRPDAVDVVSSIRCPALLLSGAQDTFSGPAAHAEMARSIPGSQLEIVPESGHMAPMEQPAAVAAAMRRWWTTS